MIDIEFTDLEARDRDTLMKNKGKEYADRKRQATASSIDIGEKVYVKNTVKENKLSTTFDDVTHTVVNKEGNDVELVNDDNGKRLRRNIVHLKKFEVCTNGEESEEESSGNNNIVDNKASDENK